MTRWFHAATAVLFALALWNALVQKPPPAADPRSQVIALLQRSGWARDGERRLPGGASVLHFRAAACPTGPELVYFPSLSRITPAERAAITNAGAKATFIHDGEVVGGLGPAQLMSRWFWRKLLVAMRLRPSEPWQSIALVWLLPRSCTAPAIDWRSLTRAERHG